MKEILNYTMEMTKKLHLKLTSSFMAETGSAFNISVIQRVGSVHPELIE